MKWTAIIFPGIAMLLCIQGFSQQVSVSGRSLRLEEVFTEIRRQTGVEFLHQSSLLKTTKPVTLDVKQMPLEEVMKICLQGQGLGFIIRSNTVVIFKEEQLSHTEQPGDQQPALVSNTIFINGRVVDQRGAPIEMASVVLMRTNTGIETDRSGAFALKVKSIQPDDSLNISFVGLRSRMIAVGNKTMLGQIVLQPSDNVLDELLVTAYGNTSERFRIGDISKVRSTEIEKSPALNVVAALSGRVAGMYIRQNGSNPSSVFNINLRGINVIPPSFSLSLGEAVNILSKPLIVIDGLPMAPDIISESGTNTGVSAITGITGASGGQDLLYWLNTLDVDNISVLKDAEATTLYGSRAANGVIIITTKKSKPGRTSLNITFSTGINAQAKRLKLLNTQQYLAMRREAWQNTIRAGLPVLSGFSLSYAPNAANSYDMLVWDTTRYTDWQKELLGAAPNYNAHIELTGGEERTSYRLSAGYNRSESSFPGIRVNKDFGEEKGTFSFSVSTRSQNNRLKLSAAVISYMLSSHQPGADPSGSIFTAPNAPAIFDSMGNLHFPEWRAASALPTLITGNPFYLLASPYTSNNFGLQARTNLSYELVRSLTFAVGAGYSRSENKQTLRLPKSSSDPLVTSYIRYAGFGNSTGVGLNVEPELRYTRTIGRHYLSLLAAGSFQSDKQEGTLVVASGYISDELMNTQVGARTISSTFNMVQRRSISALSRLSYRYANRYLLDLSARRDGSSSFSAEHRFGNFGSVGLGWIFTEERWARNQSVLTFGKLRASHGNSGSQSANPYAYLSTFRPAGSLVSSMPYFMPQNGTGIYQGIPAFAVTRIANPTYGWAKAVSIDIGADLYFLQDQRLQLTIQWYQKNIGNQLVYHPVSTVTGTTDYLMNYPVKVRNRGWETVVQYKTKQRPAGFNLNIAVNIAANKNRLQSYPGLENSLQKQYYEVGQPLIRRELYPSFLDHDLGVYSIVDSAHPIPAPYKVNDFPVITGGAQATLSYKRISISISCAFAKQKGYINVQGTSYPGMLGNYAIGNQPVSVVRDKHWQSPADSTIGGAFLVTDNISSMLDMNWGDASYVALKNTSLDYCFPESWLRKAGINGLSIYINAENLLFVPLSGYKGMNPEQPGLRDQLPLRMTVVGGFRISL